MKSVTNRESVWAKQIRRSAERADSDATEARDKAGAFSESLHEE